MAVLYGVSSLLEAAKEEQKRGMKYPTSPNSGFSKANAGPGRQLQGPRGDLTPVVYMVWALGVPLVLEFAFWVQRQPWKKPNEFAKFNLLPRQLGSIEKPYLPHYLSSYNTLIAMTL